MEPVPDRPAAVDPAHQLVPLPGGRQLEVRPAEPADLEGLRSLFAGLGREDERLRFFSAFRPSRAFLERMISFNAKGGCQLVAVVDPGLASARIVAEAGYSPLEDGNAELALTVAADWRGWLGPFLVDVLCRTAASRGIPNLEALVLVTNRPMTRILRQRGAVYMDRPDWTVSRLLVGTAQRIPSWPPKHPALRILVESPWSRWHAEEALRSAGAQVVVCPGPGALDSAGRCPALDGQVCPLVAGADLVVMARADESPWPEVLDAHGRLHPKVPVCVEQLPSRTAGVLHRSGSDD